MMLFHREVELYYFCILLVSDLENPEGHGQVHQLALHLPHPQVQGQLQCQGHGQLGEGHGHPKVKGHQQRLKRGQCHSYLRKNEGPGP